MFTPENIEWLNDLGDLTRPPFDASKLPDAPKEFLAYREKHRDAQDAVTDKLRKASNGR